MPEEIHKATESKLEIVLGILSSTALWLTQQGMSHWEGAHDKEGMLRNIHDKEIFLVYDNKIPAGTITLGTAPPFYYGKGDEGFWKEADAPAVYISGLAILPEHQGRGLGRTLMEFAEERARARGIRFIRFDAVSYYEELTNFYLERGYKIVGKRIAGRFECNFYEKVL